METIGPINRSEFKMNRLLQGSMQHSVMVIGEAADRISRDLKLEHPEIDWDKINYIRNLYVHGYFKIDMDMFWNTLTRTIPILYDQFTTLNDSVSQ